MHDHVNDKGAHFSYKPTRADRVAARRSFAVLPNAEAFLQEERAMRDGEDSEPEELAFKAYKAGGAPA